MRKQEDLWSDLYIAESQGLLYTIMGWWFPDEASEAQSDLVYKE